MHAIGAKVRSMCTGSISPVAWQLTKVTTPPGVQHRRLHRVFFSFAATRSMAALPSHLHDHYANNLAYIAFFMISLLPAWLLSSPYHHHECQFMHPEGGSRSNGPREQKQAAGIQRRHNQQDARQPAIQVFADLLARPGVSWGWGTAAEYSSLERDAENSLERSDILGDMHLTILRCATSCSGSPFIEMSLEACGYMRSR